jgi:hypothetical protein
VVAACTRNEDTQFGRKSAFSDQYCYAWGSSSAITDILRMPISGMSCRVALLRTDVSKESKNTVFLRTVLQLLINY